MNPFSRPAYRLRVGLIVIALTATMGATAIGSSALLAGSAASGGRDFSLSSGSPPAAPTQLAATAISVTEIGLSWTNPSGTLTDNHVYLWVANSCSGTANEAIDLGGVYQSYSATGLTPGTNYSFEVTASNSAGESPGSNCATAMTPPLGVPTGLAATAISETEIGLSWTNPSGTLTDNHVYLWVANSCSGSANEAIDLGGVFTSYASTGLTASTNYSFEVTASTSGLEGPRSGCANATTPPPVAPTGLTAVAVTPHKIDLSWTNAWGILSANTVYEYSSGCGTLLDTYVVVVSTAYVATGLKASTTYCFTVSASIAGVAGPPSSDASATTFNVKPAAPTGLTATAVSATVIDLAWTNPSGVLTDNKVFIYNDDACSSALGAIDIGAVTTGFQWGGLSAGTTYGFAVEAATNGGFGPASSCASATTHDAPPGQPTNVTATTSSQSTIDLAWTNPLGPLTDNAVYIYNGASCSSALGAIDLGTVTTAFEWGGLSPGTTYSFTVVAVNDGGWGPPSACASATTDSGAPGAPTDLTAVAASDSAIDLAWTNPSGPLTDNAVYIYNGASCSSALGAIDLGTVTTAFEWGGLSPGTTYSFTVVAVNDGGWGPPSACASATTTGSPPGIATSIPTTRESGPALAFDRANPAGTSTNDESSAHTGRTGVAPLESLNIREQVEGFEWEADSVGTSYDLALATGASGGLGLASSCGSAVPSHY